MRNYLFDAGNAIDSAVMKGVNGMVRAYNWATGGTKRELADEFLKAFVISGSLAIFLDESLITSSIVFPVTGGGAYLTSKTYSEFEKAEEKAHQKGMLDLKVENTKQLMKTTGYIFPIFVFESVGFGYSSEDLNEVYKNYLIALAMGSMGLTNFIMRADNLPPRKNCFARGLDKLSEMSQRKDLEPVTSERRSFMVEDYLI